MRKRPASDKQSRADECPYCGHELPGEEWFTWRMIPQTDEEWELEATLHAPDCEWVAARGNVE